MKRVKEKTRRSWDGRPGLWDSNKQKHGERLFASNIILAYFSRVTNYWGRLA